MLAYLPDHEPSIGGDLDHQPPDWISGHDIAHDADVLFHDAQYGDRRVPDARRLGPLERSTHVIEFADEARRRPGSCCSTTTRTTPTTSSKRCSTTRGGGGTTRGDRVCLAHEGMTVTLDAAGTTFAASAVVASKVWLREIARPGHAACVRRERILEKVMEAA